MDEIKNQVKLDEVKKQHKKLLAEGKLADAITLLSDALKKFPNDFYLLGQLACTLGLSGGTEEECSKNYDEAIKITERIAEFCPDPTIRNSAQVTVCHALWRSGNTKKAIEMAEKMPVIHQAREFSLNRFLDRDRQIEACQAAIQYLAWGFWWQIQLLAGKWQLDPSQDDEHYTAEQAIKLYQKSIDIFKIVYEDGDYLFTHGMLQQSYDCMAQIYLALGKTEEVIENLEKAAEHAIAFSTLPEKQKYSSLSFNTLTYQKENTTKGNEKNNAWHEKKQIEKIFIPRIKDERVNKILERLNQYAN